MVPSCERAICDTITGPAPGHRARRCPSRPHFKNVSTQAKPALPALSTRMQNEILHSVSRVTSQLDG